MSIATDQLVKDLQVRVAALENAVLELKQPDRADRPMALDCGCKLLSDGTLFTCKAHGEQKRKRA